MSHDDTDAIPLYAEEAYVEKVSVVTDQVRLTSHVSEREVVIEDQLQRSTLNIERIAHDYQVDQAPPDRQEGDTLIVSVVEERLVVEKRLFVIEELHITRIASTEPIVMVETLRTMHAKIERPHSTTTENSTDG